jgi:small GTP-binding protein
MQDKYFDKFNIMIIGDEKVGKTSILERYFYFLNYYGRYFNRKFTEDRKQTLGVACYEKDKFIDDKKYLIKIWDTAGQEKFAVMSKSYYQRAHAIIITCAINNRNSYFNLKNWLNSIKDNTMADSIQMIIIANKCDLSHEREVSSEELKEKADELNVEYFETSAKENIKIDEAFDTVVKKVFNNIYKRQKGFDLNKNSGEFSGKKGCC